MRPQEWIYNGGWFSAMRPSLVLALCVIMGALANKEKLFAANKFTIMLFMYLVMFTVSAFNAMSYERGMFWLDFFVKLCILSFIMSGMVNTKRRFLTTLFTLSITVGYWSSKCGLYGIIHPGSKIGDGPGGMFGDNNTFAVAFNMALPLIFFGGRMIPNDLKYKKYKIAAHLLFFFSISGIIATYSRGGFLGLVATLICINLFTKKKIRNFILMAIIGLIAVKFLITKEYKDRMNTIVVDEETEEREASSASRLHFWKIATIIANNNPIVGVGPQCFPVAYDYYDTTNGMYGTRRAVHSSYFQVLSNLGYPGFILWCLMFAMSFLTCFQLRRKTKNIPELQWVFYSANMLSISLFAYCVSATFVSMGYADLIYHEFILIGCLDALAKRHIAALSAGSRPAPALA